MILFLVMLKHIKFLTKITGDINWYLTYLVLNLPKCELCLYRIITYCHCWLVPPPQYVQCIFHKFTIVLHSSLLPMKCWLDSNTWWLSFVTDLEFFHVSIVATLIIEVHFEEFLICTAMYQVEHSWQWILHFLDPWAALRHYFLLLRYAWAHQLFYYLQKS